MTGKTTVASSRTRYISSNTQSNLILPSLRFQPLVNCICVLEANIQNLTTYSLHPGVIYTELGRHLDDTFFKGVNSLFRNLFGWMLKSLEEGAETTIYCSVDERVANDNGLYYSDCKVTKPSERARNMEDAKTLWDVSWEMVGLDENYDPFKH